MFVYSDYYLPKRLLEYVSLLHLCPILHNIFKKYIFLNPKLYEYSQAQS